jgi:type VI protein secretion system component Hcp
MLLYLQYILRTTQITKITWEGGGGSERPKEVLELTFKAMGMQYVRQTGKGTSSSMGLAWYWNSTDQGSPTLAVQGIAAAPSPPFLPPTQTFIFRR